MELTLLKDDSCEFPPTHLALEEPDGLLAVGGDLSCERLLEAYCRGIFPWFQDGQPILWWSPNPRTVIFTDRVHCSSSMRKHLRKSTWTIMIDHDFCRVMDYCSRDRAKAKGTWISSQIQHAYGQLHQAGFAHSVEVYDGQRLVGGLYGVALGSIFFGESMFSLEANASKTALLSLAAFLRRAGFTFIDCQVASRHLFSLGAEELPRVEFESFLTRCINSTTIQLYKGIWQRSADKVISSDGYILN